MPDPVPDRWVIVLESFPDDDRPVGRRVANLIKHAKRACGLKCISVRDADDDESGKLHQVIQALADRVLTQSELLSRRAAKPDSDKS